MSAHIRQGLSHMLYVPTTPEEVTCAPLSGTTWLPTPRDLENAEYKGTMGGCHVHTILLAGQVSLPLTTGGSVGAPPPLAGVRPSPSTCVPPALSRAVPPWLPVTIVCASALATAG